MKKDIESIKKQADEVVKPSSLKGMAHRIAEGVIKHQGYYTFIRSENSNKVFVTL